MIKYGLDKADEEGRPVFECIADGKPVYAKQGFEEVGRMEVDLTQFGGEGKHSHGDFLVFFTREGEWRFENVMLMSKKLL